ncbi:MAG TPA: amino acid permease [Afifellaceae bacterium]|nr:amino acid permease [Afifellaceae bacterium]
MSALRQHLSFPQGTALMLNVVLGAGVLILPGLAVQEAGRLALAAWIVCGLAALPLLGVFVILGRRYPNAGGIPHVAGRAFGRPAYIIGSLLFLGAVAFGLPAIALTGGHYAASLTGVSPHLAALLLLLAAAALNLLAAEWGSRVSSAISALLVVVLVAIAGLAVFGLGDAAPAQAALPSFAELDLVFAPFMMIFFAFTGWEVAANLSEEFRRPRRDFPLAMIASFILACGLYLALAYAVQRSDLHGAYQAPFAQIFGDRYGTVGSGAISAMAVILIFANLSAAIWAVSRLIFSLSREGLLPAALQRTRSGTPRAAAICTVAALVGVLVLEKLEVLQIQEMLALAGQNFLLLYGFAAAALAAMARGRSDRFLALVAGMLVAALVVFSGFGLLYPLALGVAGIVVWMRERRLSSVSASVPAE